MYSNGTQLSLKSISIPLKPISGFVIYEDANFCLEEISLAGPSYIPGYRNDNYFKFIKHSDFNFIYYPGDYKIKKNETMKQLSRVPSSYNVIQTGLW